MYYHLHAHTTKSSVGDSIIKIDDYIERAKELGLDALAVTGHGSLSDSFEFYNKCKKNNIKPILGCELYETNDRDDKTPESPTYHLVAIAKNREAFRNLLNIVSDASINGFYKKPRTDIASIAEYGKGLIGLSACLGGRISQEILQSFESKEVDYGLLSAIVEIYKTAFEEFYLEIQPGNFPEQRYVNECLVELALKTNTGLVVTSDVHYLRKNDWYYHDAHVKSNQKKAIDSPMIYPDKCYYMMDETEVHEALSYLGKDVVSEAIKNTERIVSMCNIELEEAVHMPAFDVEEYHSESTKLRHICYDSLNRIKHKLDDPFLYAERLEHELYVIEKLGFCGYFLTIRDFMLYAEENDIAMGPGRGSVGGSLVAFLADITKVDSVKHNLIFERFLSEHRTGLPDIDLDVISSKRDKMFHYAIEKYGSERCAQVSTFSVRKTKAAIRDAAKICGIEKELEDEAAKLVPEVCYDEEGDKMTDLSINDSLEAVPKLKAISQDYPEWFELARALADLPKATSIHAAGTIIAPVNLIDHLPLVRNKDKEMLATALNLDDAEGAGFVKLDFLGLATLDVIDNTSKDTGYVFDYIDNDFDDEATWDNIGSKYTTGLFQISSSLYKQRMGRLKPKNIQELANCIALVRGPCISSGADQEYIDILEGKADVKLIHPVYDEAVKDTNGILIYQESLMSIAINIGFEKEEAFNLMKAVAKKKMDKIEAYRIEFFKLGKEKGMEDAVIDKIFEIVLEAGLYLFNRAHAVEYAYLCYASAYYKTHYPLEFLKNLLTNSFARKESPEAAVKECRRLGVKFLPLDINKSSYEFSIENGELRIGFCAVKGFGMPAFEELKANRPYDSPKKLVESVVKSKCGKARMVPAIFAGAFSFYDENRVSVYHEYCEALDEEPLGAIKLTGNVIFDVNEKYAVIEEHIMAAPMISSPVNEFEFIGFEKLKNKSKFNIDGIISNIKKIKTKNGDPMAFLTLDTADGELDVTVFPNQFEKHKKELRKNFVININATKENDAQSILREVNLSERMC